MKKITLIATLLVVFTACEKADIRPRTRSCMEPTTGTESTPTPAAVSTRTNEGNGNPNSLNGGNGFDNSSSSVDPINPNSSSSTGDITDPLRKKDKKDNTSK